MGNGFHCPDRRWHKCLGCLAPQKTLEATVTAIGEGKNATVAALCASKEAQTANSIMRDEQRPWVRIEFDPKDYFGPDSPDSSGVLTCQVSFRLRNVGKSPAFNVGAKVRAYEHETTHQLIEHVRSSTEGYYVTPRSGQISVLSPSEVVADTNEFDQFYLGKGKRARYTSLIFTVIYGLDEGREKIGADVRCFTLEAAVENGQKTIHVIPHENIRGRAVL